MGKLIYLMTTSLDGFAADEDGNFDWGAIRNRVAESENDYDIGGRHLAAQAIKAGIVDEYHQIIAPVLVGNGLHWLPAGAKSSLGLVGVRRFENGFAHLHYRKA